MMRRFGGDLDRAGHVLRYGGDPVAWGRLQGVERLWANAALDRAVAHERAILEGLLKRVAEAVRTGVAGAFGGR